jgi:hypothetical protein
MELLDVLSPDDYPLDWFVARVEQINTATSRLNLVIGDIGDPSAVRMRNVPYLGSYSPAVDDVVHGIAKTNIGALVIGSARSPSGPSLAPPTWITPTFKNGFGNYGGGWQDAKYTKLPNGLVVVTGLVKSSTSLSSTALTVFTLPAVYRPLEGLHLSSVGNIGGKERMIILQVEGDGDVHLRLLTGDTAGGVLWASIEVSFVAEQ